MRIGIGYDSHPLVAGLPFVIGGVTIPFEKGLKGHSDADVLIHAVIDAILGAAGLGDIGTHFPDSDPAYKGIPGRELLKRTWSLIDGKKLRVGNIDAVVMLEAPKLAPHLQKIKENLAADLKTTPDRISVKAKTNEGMGMVGRGEGIAAQAVCLLESHASSSPHFELSNN